MRNIKASKLLLPLLSLSLLASCTGNTEVSSSSSSIWTGTGLAGALEYARSHSVGVEGKVYTVYDTYTSEDYDVAAYDLHNIFDEKVISSKLVYHYEIEDESFEETSSATYFEKDDGYTYRRGITLKNEVVDEAVTNSSGDKLKFSEHFASPLKSLEYSNFVKLNDEFLLKPQYSTDFALSLTQQSISATKVLFSIKDGKFSKITITTSASSTMVSGVYTSYRFELNFNWDEKGEVPNITPFEHKDEHDTLESALYNLDRKLSKASSYKAAITEYTTEGNGASNFYFVDNVCYYDGSDSYGNTYGARKIGSYYYEYVVKTASDGTYTVTTYDEDAISEEEILPQWRAFAVEFFDLKEGTNTYVSKDGIAQNIVSYIVPFVEADYYASYVTEIRINLSAKGEFSSVEIDFSDYVNSLSGTTNITYEGFGETELPIEIN